MHKEIDMSITDKRLTEIQARMYSVEFPDDEHLTVVNGEENLVSWVERSRRDGSVVSGAVVATVHAGPRSAEMFAHAPEDIADLLAEVERLRDELAKTREITSEKVRYGGHAIWLEAETSLCGTHECRYYGDDGDADYSCQCARCEKTAQLYAHAVLGGGDDA